MEPTSPSNVDVFHNVLAWFNDRVEKYYSRPMDTLQRTVELIRNSISSNPSACACFMCTAITTTVCFTSIAVGVGVGVGVGCTQTYSIASNSSSG
ncbi:unnamed protein product [Rotaria magnacalcarata]|uniref:Uncharacterized protein n=1 Tax=Rotaria magnacalcarata TaxID=392030 RepID=A0A815ZBH7_9BILA|nr:unnamed protein product [Rotaria magnacalcarata]CAF1968948.1 unnamed protein product [Rotaria magnacalcarata]CAF4010627.1 unnamed protein product [Rotaria magnacalcarata]CAF4082334.1 unnamed protein product [Rotaria magnacalcarata]CAF4240306.1 unnamed protein product [Rotaria magnacalcarata]